MADDKDLDLEVEETAPEDPSTDTTPPGKQKALANGWKDQDEYEGDSEDWVDWKEFNFRGDLMGRISKLGKQLGNVEQENEFLKRAVKQMTESQKEVAQRAYEKAAKDLRVERAQALREEDDERVAELELELEDLNQKKKIMEDGPEPKSKDKTDDEDEDQKEFTLAQQMFADFVNSDHRFVNNRALIQDVGTYGDQLLAEDPEIPVSKLLRKLEQYTDRKTRQRAPQPDSSSGTAGKGKKKGTSKYTPADLSEIEKIIADGFVEDGTFESLQEYVDAVAASGGLDAQSN